MKTNHKFIDKLSLTCQCISENYDKSASPLQSDSIDDFEKRAESKTLSSRHLSHALFTYNDSRRSTFAGNSALLSSDVIDFPMLPA